MNRLILTCLLLSICMVSCKKENTEPSSPSYQSNPISYEYSTIENLDLLNCFYLTGTHWNYIDSVNLTTDSVYILLDETGDVSLTYIDSHEAHQFTTMSTVSPSAVKYIVLAGGLFIDYSGYEAPGRKIYPGYGLLTAMSEVTPYDSIYIYDQFYYEVMSYQLNIDPIGEPTHKSIYYVNSDFGILRIDRFEDNILTSKKLLTSKNIVR